jgi:hypothetical protein
VLSAGMAPPLPPEHATSAADATTHDTIADARIPMAHLPALRAATAAPIGRVGKISGVAAETCANLCQALTRRSVVGCGR